MLEPGANTDQRLTTRRSQPLIGIPDVEGSDEIVRYFTSESDADQALAADASNIQRALSAIGAWSDLDFDEMLDALETIRHKNQPTPPLTLDL
ncbi:MAG: hypothetical protein AB7K36_18285 [Chloroflexota bacterium]